MKAYFAIQLPIKEKQLLAYLKARIDEVSAGSSEIRYQKIIVDLAKKHNLPITRFWFHLGEITPATITSMKQIPTHSVESLIGNQEAFRDDLQEATQFYKVSDTSKVIREKQYRRNNRVDYQRLLSLQEQLEQLSEETYESFVNSLAEFQVYIPSTQLFTAFAEYYFEFLLTLMSIPKEKCLLTKPAIQTLFEWYAHLQAIQTPTGYSAKKIHEAARKKEQRVIRPSFNKEREKLRKHTQTSIRPIPEEDVNAYQELVALDKHLLLSK